MEEGLAGGRDSELVRKCWEEVRERARRGEIVGLGKGKAEFLRRQRNRDGRDGKGEGRGVARFWKTGEGGQKWAERRKVGKDQRGEI